MPISPAYKEILEKMKTHSIVDSAITIKHQADNRSETKLEHSSTNANNYEISSAQKQQESNTTNHLCSVSSLDCSSHSSRNAFKSKTDCIDSTDEDIEDIASSIKNMMNITHKYSARTENITNNFSEIND